MDRPLSSEDAVGIAIWNNAQLRADLASVGIAEGDLIDAGLMRNPRLDMLIPVGAKPFELLLNFPIETFVQRPRRIAVAQQALDQLTQSLIQNGLNTGARCTLGARGHCSVDGPGRNRAAIGCIRVERVRTITEARLRAGDISELDTIAARTEFGVARGNWFTIRRVRR